MIIDKKQKGQLRTALQSTSNFKLEHSKEFYSCQISNIPEQIECNIQSYHPGVQCTILTSIIPDRLSKLYRLSDGNLEKENAGQLVEGKYKVQIISNIQEFAQIVVGLQPNQGICYGVPYCSAKEGRIASSKRAQPDELTRTRDAFFWPKGPAIMFLDYDPPKDAKPLTQAEVWERLITICPVLSTAPAVVVSSASGFIYDEIKSEELKGPGGWHIYVIIKDGSDIPRAGEAIYQMSWLAGWGRFDISRAGTLLERSLFDAAVWQPERLDFAAGACCEPPLQQKRPDPLLINSTAEPFDTSQLFTIPDTETLKAKKKGEKTAAEPKAAKIRAIWIDSRVNDDIKKYPVISAEQKEERKQLIREIYSSAVENRILMGDYSLLAEDGCEVTVAKLLDDPENWHGKRFADPLEPDYRDDHRIAYANLKSGGMPYLYSHAHGGQRYTLSRALRRVEIAGGEMPRIINEVERTIHKAGEVYQRGGELIRVADGSLIGIQPAWLKTHMESLCSFSTYKKKVAQIDSPNDLAQRIIANKGKWPFPELIGIETAPTIRLDGSLFDKPGYDKSTRLLLLKDSTKDWPVIPDNPNPEQVRQALKRFFEAFEYFPFKKPLDKSVFLAACLTAVIRKMLPTAPMFAVNASQMSSGKTKLAQCIGILSTGTIPAPAPWADNSEEQRKSLVSALLKGKSSLLFDNIERPISSSELCAILTSEMFEDRRLGTSERIYAPTRVLILATGNNLSIVGDLSRRILPINIDHGVESPETLSFPFDPVELVAQRWLRMRGDLLTILRGFVVAGQPAGGKGSMGSFEIWDSLVRQCVVWLRDNGLAPFELADPADVVSETINAEPDTQKLHNLLFNMYEVFESEPIKVAKLIEVAELIGGESATIKTTELLDTLLEIAGERGFVNPRRLGRWIERHSERVIGNKKIVGAGSRNGSRLWRVEKL